MTTIILKLFCWIGLHRWKHDYDNISTETGRGPITIVWRCCSRCAESKIDLIAR